MRNKRAFNIAGTVGLLYAVFALISWDIWMGDWHWAVRLVFIYASLKAVVALGEDGML